MENSKEGLVQQLNVVSKITTLNLQHNNANENSTWDNDCNLFFRLRK